MATDIQQEKRMIKLTKQEVLDIIQALVDADKPAQSKTVYDARQALINKLNVKFFEVVDE